MVDSRNSETEKTEIVNGKAIRLADCSMRKRERKRETNRREERRESGLCDTAPGCET